MTKIKQLSPHEAQKIAAGEVVERPANIVKELIENAIDAQSTAITVYIEDAGKKCIRIVDNGCGMDVYDAQKCFDRHATSKLTCVDELETIDTFGFRGEALASIAAVSKITLLTKEEDGFEGTQVIVNAAVIENIVSVACQRGTDITIADLFFNVPARKKFLKSTETEWRAIQQLFNAFCFDYPHVCFTLLSNNKQVAHHPATDSVKSRALQLWESSLHNHCIIVEKNDDPTCIVTGIISDHQHYRYDKSRIYFFVNNRWVKNYQLGNALIKGYANVIPDGRYPIAVIHLTIPAHEVDINIHPRKEEVKFLHPRRIEQALQNIVKAALENNLSHYIKKEVVFQPVQQSHVVENHYTKQTFTPFNFDTFFSQQTYQSPIVEAAVQQNVQPTVLAERPVSVSDQKTVDHVTDHEAQLFKTAENFRLIGQYNRTYIVIEKEEGLFLVDQHAAHERILYELFANKFEEVVTVQLLFPQVITLSVNDIERITPYLEIFISNGIILEQCANDQLVIQSLPVYLKNESMNILVHDVLGWISEHTLCEMEEFKKIINNKLQAQMACKAAVKAGDELTDKKMVQLLDDLEKTANRFSCPHGRPTGWLLSLHDIEKKFRRKM